MSHTNLQIPSWNDTEALRYRTQQDAELKFWQERSAWLLAELENIPRAIKEYGHLTLPDGTKLIPEHKDTK